MAASSLGVLGCVGLSDHHLLFTIWVWDNHRHMGHLFG